MKKLFLLLVAVSLLACGGRRETAQNSEIVDAFAAAGMRLLGETVSARDFTLPLVTASGGIHEETVTLSDLRGNVVFLKFWATWCGPCRAGMPPMESLYNRFRDKNFEMLAVNIRERDTDVLAFMETSNLSFPALLDSDASVSASYGVQAVPTMFLIDKEGRIIARFVGSLDWDSPQFHAALEMLLDT